MKLLKSNELKKLTTKRLLAYRNSLLKCNETPHWDEDIKEITKQSISWKNTYATVKKILSHRENIEE